MFYYVSKVFWFFAAPSNLFLLAILLGALLRATRWPRTGQRLVLGGSVGLAFFGLSPVSLWLLMGLENRFPAFQDDGAPVVGVIVLGGSFETEPTNFRGQMALNDAGERILAIGTLGRRFPHAKIVFSGGGSGFATGRTPEATLLEHSAEELGVAPGRIIYERRSLNTYENAIFSKELVHPQPGEKWLLVTSAFHIPRAVGVFRQAGWPVTPYPVDFRTAGPDDRLRFFASIPQGLERADTAAKEVIGLIAYRISGKTDALFPAPP